MSRQIENLHYVPASGALIDKRTGLRIDYKKTDQNYKLVSINRRPMLAHRVAWFLYHGAWPTGEIDHINGNGLDNRVENLRDVSKRTNQSNRYYHRKGKLLGTCLCKSTGKYIARAYVNNKHVWLGRHETEEKAHEVYINYINNCNYAD